MCARIAAQIWVRGQLELEANWDQVYTIAFTFMLFRYLLLCYSILHCCCGLELALDSFGVRFFREMDIEQVQKNKVPSKFHQSSINNQYLGNKFLFDLFICIILHMFILYWLYYINLYYVMAVFNPLQIQKLHIALAGLEWVEHIAGHTSASVHEDQRFVAGDWLLLPGKHCPFGRAGDPQSPQLCGDPRHGRTVKCQGSWHQFDNSWIKYIQLL